MSTSSLGEARAARPVPTDAPPESLVVAIVGSGGDGVALMGTLLLRMAARQGLFGMMVQSYGPQIRGGESAVVLRLATREVQYEGDQADVVLCFRLADLKRFQGAVRLHAQSLLIVDAADTGEVPEWLGHTDRPACRFPFARIENGVEVQGDPKNMLGLGLICRSLGWEPAPAHEEMRKRFAKYPKSIEANLAAFDRAFATPDLAPLPALRGTPAPALIETGNEAVARGAIEAGLRFFAGYPITPSSEIMETLIKELPAAGGSLVQAEDEIAAMGMVIGASFGGVPSMTATSGPGLSLMTEMMGLSSMAEIPVVIVDCQRAGPATGMPSRTEQSDLYHAIYAGHGDFPRAVLGVFDVVHARDVMHKAFFLAETYQMPVLVMSDAYIAQRKQIRPPAPPRQAKTPRLLGTAEGPARFDLSGDHGVSPFRVPGQSGTYMAAGIEHTPEGNPTADTAVHQQMNEKRFRKLSAVAEDTRDWYRLLGRLDAPHGIIAWGSQFGLLREWVVEHPEYRVFLPEIIHPFPLEALAAWRQGLESTVVIELSFQGQFHRYLGSLADLSGVRSIARSGGVPLTMTELTRLLLEAQ